MFTMGAKLDEEVWDTSKETNSSSKTKKQDQSKILPKNQHQLVFTFEKRKGKPVTLVGKFQLSLNEKKDILKLLKKSLACGGTINEEWIEIQGDKKDKIIDVLESEGWKFRKK